MSAYIKLATLEYPRHEGDIRLEYPDILESQTGDTFPCPTTYAIVKVTPHPVINVATQRCVVGQPVLCDDMWSMTWLIRPATPEEIEYRASVNVLDQPGAPPDVIS